MRENLVDYCSLWLGPSQGICAPQCDPAMITATCCHATGYGQALLPGDARLRVADSPSSSTAFAEHNPNNYPTPTAPAAAAPLAPPHPPPAAPSTPPTPPLPGHRLLAPGHRLLHLLLPLRHSDC